MTFEEILSSTVDEYKDYLRFKDEGPNSTLNPLDMGLVLVGQPIGVLVDLSTELEEATRPTEIELKPTEVVEQVGNNEEVCNAENFEEAGAQVDTVWTDMIEVREVKKTLTEVLVDVEPSFPRSGVVKTGP